MIELTHDVLLIVMRKAGGKSLPQTLSKRFNTDMRFEGEELLEFVLATFDGDIERGVRALISMGNITTYKLLLKGVERKTSLRRLALRTAILRSDIKTADALIRSNSKISLTEIIYEVAYPVAHPYLAITAKVAPAVSPSYKMYKFLLDQESAPATNFRDGVLLKASVLQGDAELMKFVLRRAPDAFQTWVPDTLDCFMFGSDPMMLEILLDEEPEGDWQMKTMEREMYFAVRGCQKAKIEMLMSRANAPMITEDAICAAICGLGLKLFKYLLALPGAPAASGEMLLTATNLGKISFIRMLLPLVPVSQAGHAFRSAVWHGHVEIVEMMLECSVPANCEDGVALTVAANHPELLRMLLGAAKFTSDVVRKAMKASKIPRNVRLLEAHL